MYFNARQTERQIGGQRVRHLEEGGGGGKSFNNIPICQRWTDLLRGKKKKSGIFMSRNLVDT